MKAFWWFEGNLIAGMARPGFNRTRWFDFPLDQAVVVGWIGQHSSGSTSLSAFQNHVQEYGSKILSFYNLDKKSAAEALNRLKDRSGLLSVLKNLSEASELLESYDVTGEEIHFTFSRKRFDREIAYLKDQGIETVVSLTEKHHNKDALQQHFSTFHFSITDLDAPTQKQVHQLSEIIHSARKNKQRLAVHCLAGIGRTSTMLIAAHMVLGQDLDDLKGIIARQNPAFVFAGKQADFLHSFQRLSSYAQPAN